MPDAAQLPHLLRLLEDDSGTVRRAVLGELAAFGAGLRGQVESLPDGARAWPRVAELLAGRRRDALVERWPLWLELPGDHERLEGACALLAELLGEPGEPSLGALLDELARDFAAQAELIALRPLTRFLFVTRGLRGAPAAGFHDPRNSSLTHAIQRGTGLPITLAAVLILVGQRLGLEIDGCNFPGHFLARSREEGRTILVDCFHGGRFFGEDELLRGKAGATAVLRRFIHAPTGAETLVARMLRNLIASCERDEDAERRRLFAGLLAVLPR